jgi:diaminopimelate epimerase
MHGIGNDYIYVNCFAEKVENPHQVARVLSDRHKGVGSDGLVLIQPSATADFRMQMHNSDGSEAEMCGNAIRCVGKYVFDHHLTDKTSLTIETLAGIKHLQMTVQGGKVETVTVDMGEPILIPAQIPIAVTTERYINQPLVIEDRTFHFTGVSMGNPHVVTYVDDVSDFPLQLFGPKVECHPLFPKKINTHFVQIIDRHTLKMRVWERGAGETMACGTGACAVLVASVLNDISERKAVIQLLGGDLTIEWNEKDNRIYMTGGATHVFDGEVEI